MKTDARPTRLLAACLPLALAACAATAPPPSQVPPPTPAAWQAPLPHQGSLGDLAQWWNQWGDPLLVDLIREAQDLSPSVAQARSRLAQARATQTASRAALLPALDGQASASRGFNEQIGAVASTAQAGLQAQW